jgi:hypothetical protein
MSAFVCGPDHFIALAVFATGGRQRKVDPRYVKGIPQGIENLPRQEIGTLYANTLYAANIRSVMARYPEDTVDSIPGPCDKPEQIAVTHKHYEHINWVLKPVQILKMLNCLEYQSCEADDWEKSTAFNLLEAIRRAAIRQLPGYDDAPWDYDASERKAA